ncbi:DNA-binding transcriptional regulator, MocR family, contains an aminotransferase domain [Cohaesibacter sp. ES.047]|nr:DNA-binding transcriptional regulator, MocR family, contains an aminotransferase domain [Cohaesibacter sp. ES.047]
MWFPDPDKLKRPVYKTLQGLIIDAIDAGELRPGERMPTHRDFAFQMKISVQTVSRTYDALCRLGYLVGEVGRGTFVRIRDTSSEAAMPFLPTRHEELIDLSMLKPVTDRLHYDAMQKGLVKLSDDLTRDLVQSFRPEEAFRDHAKVASRWLQGHRMDVDWKSLIFTNGAVPALLSAVMSAAPAGSAICVEELSFHILRPLCEYLGVRIHATRMDRMGLLPEAFEEICSQQSIRALVISPTVCNPRAHVMSLERRQEILEIARRNKVHIIENDVLGTMVKGAPPTLWQLDPDRVFYLTSFSKTIMPGLRAGILVLPPSMRVVGKNRHLVTNWMANPLAVDLLTLWMQDGTVDKLINWQGNALQKRQKLIAKLLPGVDYDSHKYAPHIWLPLPPNWQEGDFVAQARRHQVAIAGSLPFMMSDQSNEGDAIRMNAVRIALGPCREEQLSTALRVIASLIGAGSEAPLPLF